MLTEILTDIDAMFSLFNGQQEESINVAETRRMFNSDVRIARMDPFDEPTSAMSSTIFMRKLMNFLHVTGGVTAHSCMQSGNMSLD